MFATPRLRHLPWATLATAPLALFGLLLWFQRANPYLLFGGTFFPFLAASLLPVMGLLADWWRLRRPSSGGLFGVLFGGASALGLAILGALWADAVHSTWPTTLPLLLLGAPAALVLAFGALAPHLLRVGRLPPVSLLWGTVKQEEDERLLLRTDQGAWLSLPRRSSRELHEEPHAELAEGSRLALVGLFRHASAEVSPYRDEERIEALHLWMVDASVEGLSRRILSRGVRVSAFLGLAAVVSFVFARLGALHVL